MTASWQDRSDPVPSTRAVAVVWLAVLAVVAASCLAVGRPEPACPPPDPTACEEPTP